MQNAALDGDGHTISSPGFYKGRVPERWLLEDVFRRPLCYKGCGPDGGDVHGIASLDVHVWVACLVAQTDPTFAYPHYLGRGKQARAIWEALTEWVGER